MRRQIKVDSIKEVIQGKEYSFLKDDTDLKDIIFLTISGSYAYGTNNSSSDIDLRGVALEHPKYLYGLNSFEQFEDHETDTVIFGLKKYISLCVNANPSALELLGTNDECIVKITKAGELLRENVSIFLSKRVIQSYGNYASSQLRRLENALCHDQYNSAEQEEYLLKTLNAQMEHFNDTYTPLEEKLRMYLSNEIEPQLVFDVDLKAYPVREFAGLYGEINNIVRTYGKMNHRNRKKDDAHLYKHAMHLIRLLIVGEDILLGKGVISYREQERELLLSIRNEKYTFEEIMEMTDYYQERFSKAANTTKLPAKPNIEKIESLMLKIYNMRK